jgi:CBS domain-containing protein
MKASEIMSRNVATVGPDTPVVDAIHLMLDRGISGLPVVDSNGKVVGIVTEGDLLRRAEMRTERQRPRWLEFLLGPCRLAEEYVRTHGRKVGEIMTEQVISVSEDTPLAAIVELMERHRVKRLPVLRGDALIGIVSRADLMRALVQFTASETASACNDDEIREQVLAELAKSVWAPRAGISIAVENGVVDLDGTIINEKERAALRVAAENTPGVKTVRDHLVWVELVSGTVISAPEE